MPRPRKWRKVCCLPDTSEFGPIDEAKRSEDIVNLTIDEYETMRLIDLENYTQQQCAEQMDVARSTVQAIYNSARRKVTDSIVNGHTLMIGGGEYILCNENGCCNRQCCMCRNAGTAACNDCEVDRNEINDTNE